MDSQAQSLELGARHRGGLRLGSSADNGGSGPLTVLRRVRRGLAGQGAQLLGAEVAPVGNLHQVLVPDKGVGVLGYQRQAGFGGARSSLWVAQVGRRE